MMRISDGIVQCHAAIVELELVEGTGAWKSAPRESSSMAAMVSKWGRKAEWNPGAMGRRAGKSFNQRRDKFIVA
jgi:hypothetical protein